MVAAANMLGGTEDYAELPWLWSDQFDCNIQTFGMIEASHTVIARGDALNGPLCLLALDEQQCLRAVVAIDAGRDMGACKRLVAAGKPLDAALLADASVNLRSLL